MALGALVDFRAMSERATVAIGSIPKILVTNARIVNISQQEQQYDDNAHLSFNNDGSCIETQG